MRSHLTINRPATGNSNRTMQLNASRYCDIFLAFMRPVAAETSVRYRSELRITAHREVRTVLRSFSVLWKTRKRAYPLTITGRGGPRG